MGYRNRIAYQHPAAALDPVLVGLKTQLTHAQHQAATAIADERRLRQWVDYHDNNAAGWEQRAMLAVRAGDDGLARAALERKAACKDEADAYRAHWQSQKQGVDALKAGLRALSDRIDAAHRERNSLVARTAAAQARMAVAHTLAQLDAMSPHSTLNRIEERVIQLEAQAEAAGELYGGDDSLEAQFRALETVAVDDQLAQLKAKMGHGPLSLTP